jgi:hypothetical protein
MEQSEIQNLLDQYHQDTMFHSLPAPMMNTDSFKQIIELGYDAVPQILESLRSEERRGMSFVLLLEQITHENHVAGEPIEQIGMMAVSIDDTIQNWLDWGLQKGYIK